MNHSNKGNIRNSKGGKRNNQNQSFADVIKEDILYKADQDPDLDLQKRWTPDL